MSIHACEWAHERGCELKLSCPERVTLWQLARRAATKGFCWPSIVQLMFDTGLARQTVLTVVHALADHGLIRIEKEGQRFIYHLVLPVQNKTGDRSNIRPDKSANRSKSRPATGLKSSPNRSKNIPETGLNLDPNLKYNQKENLKRARETREAPDGAEPEKRVFDSDLKEEGGTPPPVPSDQQPEATTTGSEPFQGLDDAKAFMSQKLGRTVHLDAPEPDAVTEDDRPKTEADRERMAAQIAAMLEGLAGTRKSPTSASTGGKLSMRAYPPGHKPIRDRWDQADACKAPLRDVTLKGDQLAAARRIAMAGLPVP